jgi:hypothetical protein
MTTTATLGQKMLAFFGSSHVLRSSARAFGLDPAANDDFPAGRVLPVGEVGKKEFNRHVIDHDV